MKKIHLVYSITENDKHFAYCETIGTGNNLLPFLRRVKGLHIAHICETRTQAEYIAADWNASYRANGTHLYDTATGEEVQA